MKGGVLKHCINNFEAFCLTLTTVSPPSYCQRCVTLNEGLQVFNNGVPSHVASVVIFHRKVKEDDGCNTDATMSDDTMTSLGRRSSSVSNVFRRDIF